MGKSGLIGLSRFAKMLGDSFEKCTMEIMSKISTAIVLFNVENILLDMQEQFYWYHLEEF
jgi:hypothetical protein